MRLAQVLVFVVDMARMQRFYRDLLGLAVIDEAPGFARYDAGGTRLALHAIPAEIAATIAITDPPERRADAAIKVAFEVDDLAATRARLAAAGIAIGEIWTWGGQSACDGVDPEGNVFQLASQ